MQLKAVIGAMTSILSIDPWSFSGLANMLFSILVLLFYFVLILLVIYLITIGPRSSSREKTRTSDKKGHFLRVLGMNLGLFKQLKEENKERKRSRAILAVSIIQDFSISLGLTIFLEVPAAQIITAIIFMSLSLYTVIRYSPFQKVEVNFVEAGNRAIYILILIVFLINYLFEDKMSDKTKFDYIGFGVIGLISLLITFNISVSVWSIVKELKSKFTKKNEIENKNKKNKIQPIEKVDSWILDGEDHNHPKGLGSPEASIDVSDFEYFHGTKSLEKESDQLQIESQPFKTINFCPKQKRVKLKGLRDEWDFGRSLGENA